ncbi:hypothetical protein, partial [Streptococcus pneumoniae]|uniref:hypothetical protein n=1 Tax=Streptococcus pneumoniae TaxID=1313 RepID=UPI001953516E
AKADPDFVIEAMKAVIIVDVNDKGVALMGGRSRADFVGQTALGRWPTGKHDVFLGSINAGFRGESSFQAETRAVR